MASYWKASEHIGTGCVVDEGRGKSDPEEGLQILHERWVHLSAPKETDVSITVGSNKERGQIGANVRIPCGPLVRTQRNVGVVREAEGEILVVGYVCQRT